jgi:hypothetical protein
VGSIVNVCPIQSVPFGAEITGRGITVTVTIAGVDETHPAVVPVIVYAVVESGLTVALPPEIVYDVAPEGEIV